MFCNPCKLENIKHIVYHNTIFDQCKECDECSLLLSNYEDFILNILVENKIENVSRLTDVSLLSDKQQKRIEKFLSQFSINFAEFDETKNICRACDNKLYKYTFNSGIQVYLCGECLRIYFNISEFNKHINYVLKKYNKNYFKNIKRFLQKFKWSKNNVKK